jgi:hypothetical protein
MDNLPNSVGSKYDVKNGNNRYGAALLTIDNNK